MTIWRALTVMSVVLLAGSVSPAPAQGFQPECIAKIKQLCGRVSPGRCFEDESLWDAVPARCSGDIQTMIEMEREASEEQTQSARSRTGGADITDMRGQSYGGVQRSGPSMNSRKLGSLYEGDNINILEDTGVWFNDYKWFRIDSPIGVGFHWGGIFCTESDQRPDGVLSTCGGQPDTEQGSVDETVDAADYVRAFYTEPSLSAGVSRDNEMFFTNPAIDAIRSNNAASGGCIDTNPFVDAQDYDIDEITRTLTVTANRAANGQMLVEVDFDSFGEREYLVWTLVGSSGYWQVSDIEGSDPGSRLGAIRCN